MKLYFRSVLYSEYYFVDMTLGETGFEAVLPLPSAETPEIAYYLEALDDAFQTARSPEYTVEVTEKNRCRTEPGGLFFPGDAVIVVGSASARAAAFPPGFLATGGVAAGAGGGIGTGVVIGVTAGAAAGVGVVIGTNTGGDDNQGGGGTPAPAGPSSGGGGSTTTTSTTPETTTTTTTSSSTTTTTADASGSTTTTVPATLACFNAAARGNCEVQFDACTHPVEGITYEWRMLGPPVSQIPPDAPSFKFSFTGDPRCNRPNTFNRPVRLTVSWPGGSDSIQQGVDVVPGAGLRASPRAVQLSAYFLAPPADGSLRARILAGGASIPLANNTVPALVPLGAGPLHEILVAVVGPGRVGASLKFELPDGRIDPSSVTVDRGTLLIKNPSLIVFQLEGAHDEQVRFRFRLMP